MEGNPEPISSSETGRIQVIIEAAEKAAAGIIEDAEAQARRYLDESRKRADRIAEERAQAIGDATDGLLERAEVLKRHSDELIRALQEASLQIGGDDAAPQSLASAANPEPAGEDEPAPEPAAAPEPAPLRPRASHLKPVESPPPEEEPEPEPESHQTQDRPPQEPYAERRRSGGAIPTAGARLLATQMAVGGSSRAEIEQRLRSDFGIENAEELLDGILGPES
jgi:vacuolar-type H+-ATPase subunit H